jgi:hypothetical protein
MAKGILLAAHVDALGTFHLKGLLYLSQKNERGSAASTHYTLYESDMQQNILGKHVRILTTYLTTLASMGTVQSFGSSRRIIKIQ